MSSKTNLKTSTIEFFALISQICPIKNVDKSCVITVVVDEQYSVGKSYNRTENGFIDKKSKVAIVRVIACQFHVPDHETLQIVLHIVSENEHAAIINAGWKNVEIGEHFLLLSKAALEAAGYDHESICTIDGVKAFARLKIHSTPSAWQLLDRDEDTHTPEWARKQPFDGWRINLDKIFPGIAKVTMLRAHSSSARVLDVDGTPVGKGNGHVWIKIANPTDAERSRNAIIARALENNLSWTKPRFAKATGLECGRGLTTIIDPSVWTQGRLVFGGRPTCSGGLTIVAQQFELIKGENDELDTSMAVISAIKSYRASKALGTTLRISRNGTGCTVIHNLTLDTELELEDGSSTTVGALLPNLTGKIRIQAPFRASSSMAAFIAIGEDGRVFVYDSGTDTLHVLAKTSNTRLVDKDREKLIQEIKSRIGYLLGDINVDAVLNEDVLRDIWDATFYLPTNSKIILLNEKNELVDLSVAEVKGFGFERSFGNVYYTDLLSEVILEQNLSPADEKALRATISWLEYGPLIECLKLLKQAKSLIISVDMFVDRASLSVADSIATISLPHRRFTPPLSIKPEIIEQVVEDYKQHMPEFTAFIDLVLYARFATDRRHAFVWLHSPSSWGKGFLVVIFTQLGLVVQVQPAEIEKAMSGGPVGISLADTLRAWILFVDEFKAASSELKLLNKEMAISPKNQLRCTVQLYTKLFASAENVRSLVGDGAEAQFNNRFAYLSPSTNAEKLEDRQLFKDVGKSAYLNALVAYVGEYLNAGVARLCALGCIESSKIADDFIEKYQSERKLNATFGNLDDAIDDVVDEIRHCLIEYAAWWKDGSIYDQASEIVKGLGTNLLNTLRRTAIVGNVSKGENSKQRHLAVVLSNPVPFIKGYIALSSDRSTVGKLQYKADEIATKLHMRGESHQGKVRVYSVKGVSEEMVSKRGIVIFIPEKDLDIALPLAVTEPIKKAKILISAPK